MLKSIPEQEFLARTNTPIDYIGIYELVLIIDGNQLDCEGIIVSSELGEGKARPSLNRYIEARISDFDEYAKTIPVLQKNSWEELNHLFSEIVCSHALK